MSWAVCVGLVQLPFRVTLSAAAQRRHGRGREDPGIVDEDRVCFHGLSEYILWLCSTLVSFMIYFRVLW